MRLTFTAVFTSALISFVSAHGIVEKIEAGGQTYNSPLIGHSGDTGPFYLVSDNSPITDVTSNNLLCGNVATDASSTGQIAAGGQISYYWGSGYAEGIEWPHNTGPMFLYITKCADDSCQSVDSSSKFFKVTQFGIEDGSWVQGTTLYKGLPVSFTVPSDLEAGTYMFRHEVINLASTDELYPSCARFQVTGSGSNTYSSADSTSFPGAYAATDKGLTVAGSAVYSITSNADYVFPGPNPIDDASSSGSSSSGSSDSSDSSSSTVSASSASSTSIPPLGHGIAVGSSSAAAATSTAGDSSGSSDSVAAPTDSESTSTTIDSSASTASPSSASSSSSGISNCATQWTQCNAAYDGSDPSSYTCQTEYVSCMNSATSTSSNSTKRAVHNHYRRQLHGRSRLESLY